MRPLSWIAGCAGALAIACGTGDYASAPGSSAGSAGNSAGSGASAGAGGGAGTSGSAGTGGSAGGVVEPPLSCDERRPGPAPLRLLTRVQYDNTVADLLGTSSRPATGFPAENEVQGYRNNTAANQVSPLLVEKYLDAAEVLAAEAVTSRLETLAPCAAGADTTACGREFVRSFGLRAFRRPLEAEELAIFDGLFDATLDEGYAKAIELVIQATLQSPQFLYRVEALQAPTPETGAIALAPYELASRLAYFLTNSMPDAALLERAANGALATAAEIEAEARRLIATARARETALDFQDQWLGLSRLEGAAREAPDLAYGPTELVPDFKGSLAAFLEDAIFGETGTVENLFTSPKFFVNQKLAPLYGVSAPAGGGFEASTSANRAGLLTQPAIMALFSHADQSAPVLRGAFVRERIMCLPVDPPPPDVNPNPPPVDVNATTRERFAQHTAEPTCAGCHVLIDGVGFGFERFDQFGRYREFENSLRVDESGEVVGTADPELEGAFVGAAELSARLARSARVRDCVATHWYRYAMGRVEDTADSCSLEQVKDRFRDGGGKFTELLVGIALSDAFRYRPAMTEAP
jgi:hypothetical protein